MRMVSSYHHRPARVLNMPDDSNAVYCRMCRSVLHDMIASTANPAWKEIGLEEQSEIFGVVTRLYGEDQWTSGDIRALIDGELA